VKQAPVVTTTCMNLMLVVSGPVPVVAARFQSGFSEKETQLNPVLYSKGF